MVDSLLLYVRLIELGEVSLEADCSFALDSYAGHLIPPKRIEFGRIQKNSPESGGGTRVAITGKTDEEKAGTRFLSDRNSNAGHETKQVLRSARAAVWKTLGEGNEDMVEWIVLAAALTVLDDEIIQGPSQPNLSFGSAS